MMVQTLVNLTFILNNDRRVVLSNRVTFPFVPTKDMDMIIGSKTLNVQKGNVFKIHASGQCLHFCNPHLTIEIFKYYVQPTAKLALAEIRSFIKDEGWRLESNGTKYKL
jgi:hypothetical protein